MSPERTEQQFQTYRVKRTSQPSDDPDQRPCDDARWGTYTDVDQRTFDTEAKYDDMQERSRGWGNYRCAPWRDEGYDHGTWDNNGTPGIQRKIDREGWIIDLSPDSLLAFAKTHGEIVLKVIDGTPSLEIYDDYRE